VRNLIFFLSLCLLWLIYACSETQDGDEQFLFDVPLDDFNDFVSSNLYEIPNIKIEAGSYFNHEVGKYSVDAFVDSICGNVIYLKIRDLIENTTYRGYSLNAKKNGWWEIVHNNSLLCCGNYVLNKKDGFWQYYTNVGLLYKSVYFRNDTLHGLAYEYSGDSTLLSEGHYIVGLKSDYWKYFYQNGKIKEQGHFYKGFRSGWWQFFELNGDLKKEASYSRNEISGFMKLYFNGVLLEEGKVFNKRKRGTWKSYNAEGKLKAIHEHGE